MEIRGTGIDMVDMDRLVGRDVARMAEYICTADELRRMELSRSAEQYVASRLALKEAVIKASPERLFYHDIEIRTEGGKLSASVAGSRNTFVVSLSHELRYCIAQALCLY